MRFFTADLHWGHQNIIRFCERPFADTDHMREVIIARWNQRVGPNDEVYLLGDIVMGDAEVELEHLRRLNGSRYLIAGNHDKVWEGNKQAYREKWQGRYQDAFTYVISDGPPLPLEVAKTPVTLCHFPYTDIGRHGDKYAAYRPIDDGGWLLCGHVHQAWQVQGRQINVGVDVWDFYPVSEAEIASEIEGSQR